MAGKYFAIFLILVLGFVGGLLLAEAPAKENEVQACSWDTLGYYQCIYIVIEVPMDSEDWLSLDELKIFLKEHKDEAAIIGLAGRDGKVQMSGQCVGRVMGWRDLAESYGKNLEMQTLTPLEYRKWFGGKKSDNHEVLKAILKDGSAIYYISAETLVIKHAGYVP